MPHVPWLRSLLVVALITRLSATADEARTFFRCAIAHQQDFVGTAPMSATD